jgi:hypothetical protein
VRYAWETDSIHYERFMARKASFVSAHCEKPPWDSGRDSRCSKPAPYNQFDWGTDGCSVWVLSRAYSALFRPACEQHDFAYRNIGNGLSLDRSESARRRIDDHLWDEAQRICKQRYDGRLQIPKKEACFSVADSMRTFFRSPAVAGHTKHEQWNKPCDAGKCHTLPVDAPSGPATPPDDPAPEPPVAPDPSPGPVDPGPAPAPAPAPAPTPDPTWNETTGSVAHTWTNYTNAGGYEGPTIASNASVQIACKLPGFRVADGNTWWYRIAQSPWNGQYYVSADAFYNNGQTSGSLHGTPFVDGAVRDC